MGIKHEHCTVKFGDKFAMELFKAYCKKTPPSETQVGAYRYFVRQLRINTNPFDKNLFKIMAYCQDMEEAIGISNGRASATGYKEG